MLVVSQYTVPLKGRATIGIKNTTKTEQLTNAEEEE